MDSSISLNVKKILFSNRHAQHTHIQETQQVRCLMQTGSVIKHMYVLGFYEIFYPGTTDYLPQGMIIS